jgi:hypothetical protein|nr:MAG TPA: glycoprotein [Caudoviricetes sp.]
MATLFELIIVALVAMIPPYYLLWIVLCKKRNDRNEKK